MTETREFFPFFALIASVLSMSGAQALASDGADCAPGMECLSCATHTDGVMTDCDFGKLVARSAVPMDYTITYSLHCRRIYGDSYLGFSTMKVMGTYDALYPVIRKDNVQITLSEATDVYFNVQGSPNPTLSRDCSLVIHSITRRPASSTTRLWHAEAQHLTELIKTRGEFYLGVKDYSYLLANYTAIELDDMTQYLLQMFKNLVACGLKPGWDVPDAMVGESACGLTISPRYYASSDGLTIATWEELDVLAIGLLVAPPANEFEYTVNTHYTANSQWYKDAKDGMPVMTEMLNQIAQHKTATALRQGCTSDGQCYALPSLDEVKRDLQATILRGKEFLRKIAHHRDLIGSQANSLDKAIAQAEARL